MHSSNPFQDLASVMDTPIDFWFLDHLCDNYKSGWNLLGDNNGYQGFLKRVEALLVSGLNIVGLEVAGGLKGVNIRLILGKGDESFNSELFLSFGKFLAIICCCLLFSPSFSFLTLSLLALAKNDYTVYLFSGSLLKSIFLLDCFYFTSP